MGTLAWQRGRVRVLGCGDIEAHRVKITLARSLYDSGVEG
jgi:hypothetical protein